MSTIKAVLRMFAIATFCFAVPTLAKPHDVSVGDEIIYTGGLIWKDGSFVPADIATAGGIIVNSESLVAPRRVSLDGQYIVPAYGNAHAHLTSPRKSSSDYFLSNGVFYVLNPNTIIMDAEAKAFFARRDTFDVAVAQGGITSPGGHPEALYVDVLTQFAYPGKTRDYFFGNAFHYGRNPEEIAQSLDTLAAQGADYVKAYLLYSEEFEQRSKDPKYRGYFGLDPKNVKTLVKLASERNLRVGFHVETIADLLAATKAGAHSVMHMPGHSSYAPPLGAGNLRIELTDREAEQVARSGIHLVATYALLGGSKVSEEIRKSVRDTQAANIRKLGKYGAQFLIGTDTRGEIFGEVEWLDALAAMPRTDLLHTLFATGREIFPHRKVGCLDLGCEADFLVLERNPIDQITALREISRRIKAGIEIQIDAESD